MLLDNSSLRGGAGDQAEGLRQLRRSAPASEGRGRVLPWPRLVLISEFPGTDAGARFAFHLARALGSQSADGFAEHSLLVDLAPAASRTPQVLADWIPADRYPPLWSEMAVGQSLSTIELGGKLALAVAAESQMTPSPVDQLPRRYEQFVRQLSRRARWRWIVLLALDHIVPLDRACWQAADDILLLGNSEAADCQRQAAALRSRVIDADPQRRLWTLATRRTSWQVPWRSRSHAHATAEHWTSTDMAPRPLPAVPWPSPNARGQLRQGTRADDCLARSAQQVASALQAAAVSDECCAGRSEAVSEDSSGLVKLSGSKKKIQLRPQLRPITQLSEMFRA